MLETASFAMALLALALSMLGMYGYVCRWRQEAEEQRARAERAEARLRDDAETGQLTGSN